MKNHLKFAKLLANLLDNQFNILGFKFGLSAIIDLIPGLGDIIDLVLSFYLVWIGIQMKLPGIKIAEMVKNIAFNFLIGSIPIVGDAIYALNKINLKNLAILTKYAPGTLAS